MEVTLKQFVHGLVDSGLMTTEEVRAFRDSLPAGKRITSVKQLAQELIAQGKLTEYQAARIAEGKAKGLILGNNILLEKIGEGGMGEVFRAQHRRMKRPVVVKVLPEAATRSEYNLKRFQREVEAAAQLSHPNIVTAFDADEENGVYFLVMEYVDGEDLGTIVSRDGPLSVAITLDCIYQAAKGLDYAHTQGIIHRDIKPDNLLLDSSGIVKILDMGLARFDVAIDEADTTRDVNLTRDHQIIGTVDYMSPEQADDSAHVDARSDIYSLGCTMYRLLTGVAPYDAGSIIQTLVAHRTEPIPSIRATRDDVPEQLDRIFQRMVAKDPKDRYQTMGEVIRALIQFVEDTDFKLVSPTSQLAAFFDSAAPARIVEAEEQKVPAGATTVAPTDRTIDVQASQLTVDTVAAPAAEAERKKKLADLAVGIDLGTTYSAIAYLDDLGRPQTVMNAEGDKTTPSVVLFDEQDVVVGKEAVKAMGTDMEMIAECAKRDLGSRVFHKLFRDKQYPPEVLEAWVLNKLRRDAQRQIGKFQKVVITVPAYFDEIRRKATQDAGYMAGFEVMDIINEPSAAAIAFGFKQGFLKLGSGGARQRILVYDLGGGTFDVTVMETDGQQFIMLATDGDVKLGGRDWDDRLVDYVAERFLEQHGVDPRADANALGRLLRACEDAKHTLSARQKTFINCDYEGFASRIEVTRAKFQELTTDLLGRTEFTARQTLQAAGLDWKDLDRVLLVGGSTRMPAVVEMLRRASGKEPDCTISPDEAVAHGAALHASLLLESDHSKVPKFTVTNVNSHNLGVVGIDRKTKRQQIAVLIPRNTPLPVTAEKTFFTHRDGQQSVFVRIVEGESELPEACSQVGKVTVRDLPPDLPAQTAIAVRFSYEENGRLTVTVKVAGTDKQVRHQIVRENSLSEEDLHRWRQRISGLPPAARPSTEDAAAVR